MGGLRERKKEQTRLDLIRSAVDLFQERGYEATTVDDITERANYSRSTFFRYFGSKEDVVFLDLPERLASLVGTLRAADPAGDPFPTARDAIVAAVMEFTTVAPELEAAAALPLQPPVRRLDPLLEERFDAVPVELPAGVLVAEEGDGEHGCRLHQGREHGAMQLGQHLPGLRGRVRARGHRLRDAIRQPLLQRLEHSHAVLGLIVAVVVEVDPVHDLGDELLERVEHRGREDLLFRGEVAVEDRLLDAGFLGDLPGPGAHQAPRQEHLARRRQDLSSPLGGGRLALAGRDRDFAFWADGRVAPGILKNATNTLLGEHSAGDDDFGRPGWAMICDSEAIVTKPGESRLECCGTPMVVIFEPAASGG